MKNALALKVAVPVAVTALALLSAAPIGAQTIPPQEEVATLTITKTVVGTAPADAQFTLHLSCSGVDDDVERQATDYDEDIVFGATGGSQDFTFTGPSECEVTEVDDGGATSSSGAVQVAIENPISYEAEIVNTFVDGESTTSSTAAPAAEAVEATASFTG
jgi:hypothetical protein